MGNDSGEFTIGTAAQRGGITGHRPEVTARGRGPTLSSSVAPPPARDRSKLNSLTGDKLIKSVAETLVNFQATAPAKPSADYLQQAAMRLCTVLLKLCGSVETLTAVHRSVYTAIEGVSIDVKGLDAFEGILTTGHLHWAQVAAKRGLDLQNTHVRRRRKFA